VKLDLTEAIWLDERGSVTLLELSQCSGLSEGELRDLVDIGVLEPVDPHSAEWSFGARCIVSARAARRLRGDFELDTDGLALVLSLLERIEVLENELKSVHARVPRRPGR
jgi:chaperone modulatory protein CbpM